MAIDRIGSRDITGALLLQGSTQGGRRAPDDERGAPRAGRVGDAMTVEISPAGRRVAAERAVAAANLEAARSTAWFASSEGSRALAQLPPGSGRARAL